MLLFKGAGSSPNARETVAEVLSTGHALSFHPVVIKHTVAWCKYSAKDMRRLSVSIVILLTSVLCYAQSNDTLAHPHRIRAIGVFVHAGVGLPQYYSDKYFEFLAAETFTPADGSTVNSGSIDDDAHVGGGATQSILGHDTPSLSPVVALGVVFRPANARWPRIDHSVIVSYAQCRGHFTSRASYAESNSQRWYARLTDTISNEFTQSAFSLEYRARLTYSHVWFSVGAGVSNIKVKVDQYGTSYVDGSEFYEIGPDVPYTRTQPYASHGEAAFWNFPLEVGCGLRFQTGRVFLLPAFYLSAYFGQEYLFPRAGVEVQYEFK